MPTAPIDTREEKPSQLVRNAGKISWEMHGRPIGTNHLNSSVRTREYLTTAEIERLMAAARKSSRYGHRDATMILIGYRHGLRVSELCDLQWSQVELTTGRLHVRRARGSGQDAFPDTSAHAAAWLRRGHGIFQSKHNSVLVTHITAALEVGSEH
jgi:integrase